MSDGWLLARMMRNPAEASSLDDAGWISLIAMARAEQMMGTLAARLQVDAVPADVARIFADARASAAQGHVVALWEVEAARRALAPLGVPVVLLKGSAFVAAGLSAAEGRSIGDLDILVPRDCLDAVETALLAAGWEWVKPDPYDDAYYRRWMHELPPLIHRDRDRMIDVHHTILPLTARVTPDAKALIADSRELSPGVKVLTPNDMIIHAAAHLFADGDLAGGMRNLWDVHCLVDQFGTDGLEKRAVHHQLSRETGRAVRLAAALYGERPHLSLADYAFLRRVTARDGWGRATRPFTRLAFYVRSHWMRMPPLLLAQHLWTKWRREHRN